MLSICLETYVQRVALTKIKRLVFNLLKIEEKAKFWED